MAKRLAALGAVVAVLALTVSMVAPALSDETYQKQTIRLSDKFADDAQNVTEVDVGKKGESVGDYFVFDDVVYNTAGTQRKGKARGSCVAVSESALDCEVTFDLQNGNIRVEGSFVFAEGEAWLAVTGGTGAYKTAHGETHVVEGDKGLDFTIKLLL
jgi:hypothetical protein